ncbi:hypothetical protein [Nannocystis pusilla]|uniref:hypothetical protein n=1 Tax=Nannocystis pusilla TaxID=889268 RepID=UPI003B7A1463
MHRTLLYRTNRLAFFAWWAAISVGVGAVLTLGLGLLLGFRAESLMFASLMAVPLVAIVTLLVLIVKTDQPGPGLTKRPFIELVWGRGSSACATRRGRARQRHRRHAPGAAHQRRQPHASGPLAADPHRATARGAAHPRGPWPTVPAVSGEGARLVEDAVYDALAAHAQ